MLSGGARPEPKEPFRPSGRQIGGDHLDAIVVHDRPHRLGEIGDDHELVERAHAEEAIDGPPERCFACDFACQPRRWDDDKRAHTGPSHGRGRCAGCGVVELGLLRPAGWGQ